MHKLPLLDLMLVREIIFPLTLVPIVSRFITLFQGLCNRERVCRSVKFNELKLVGRIHSISQELFFQFFFLFLFKHRDCQLSQEKKL